MDNTITFELPVNEYNIESFFDHREGFESIRIWGYNEEGSVSLLDYSRFYNSNDMTYCTTLIFPNCVENNFQKDLSINKIEFNREGNNSTINLKFQAEAETDIHTIKDSIKNCGFKVKW